MNLWFGSGRTLRTWDSLGQLGRSVAVCWAPLASALCHLHQPVKFLVLRYGAWGTTTRARRCRAWCWRACGQTCGFGLPAVRFVPVHRKVDDCVARLVSACLHAQACTGVCEIALRYVLGATTTFLGQCFVFDIWKLLYMWWRWRIIAHRFGEVHPDFDASRQSIERWAPTAGCRAIYCTL